LRAGFDFQERGLTQWARQRAETLAQDEEAKFQQKLQAYLAANDLPAAPTATATATAAATAADSTSNGDSGSASVADGSKAVSGWNVRLKHGGDGSPKSRAVSSDVTTAAAGSSAGAAVTVLKADASTQVCVLVVHHVNA
jgi:hypothetical protein